jgi:hypothetical protein
LEDLDAGNLASDRTADRADDEALVSDMAAAAVDGEERVEMHSLSG